MIRLVDIEKKFNQNNNSDRYVINGVSLTINEGEGIAIIGKSGSGKSTLLNIIGLLDDIDSGEYTFEGKRVDTYNEAQLTELRNQKFGYIFQQYYLLQHKTVIENIALPLYYRKVDKDTRIAKAKILIEQLDLIKVADSYPQTLSGGEAQRVAIARALIGKPQIILADEPTGALDEFNSKLIVDILKSINKTNGTTVLVVTHDTQIANEFNKTITIRDGYIQQ